MVDNTAGTSVTVPLTVSVVAGVTVIVVAGPSTIVLVENAVWYEQTPVPAS